MGRMVRKQVYMDERLDHELARMAERLKVSQAEIVRRALDAYVNGETKPGESLAMRRLREHWADVDRKGAGSGPEGRTWTREELHDRGHGRY